MSSGPTSSGPAETKGQGFQIAASLATSASAEQHTNVTGQGPIQGAVFNFGSKSTTLPSWQEVATVAVIVFVGVALYRYSRKG